MTVGALGNSSADRLVVAASVLLEEQFFYLHRLGGLKRSIFDEFWLSREQVAGSDVTIKPLLPFAP